jgi:RNA polymerase sigma-70 factor (ECF subfamily)
MADERLLILRLQQRDEDALSQVFNDHADQVYRLAISLLRDEQQADGVVQNTFLALIQHIDRFEGKSSIGTWLYRVAHNECMGRLRRANPQLPLDDMLDEDFMPDNFTSWDGVPDTVLKSREALTELDNAVATLSPTLRSVFVLRDVEGLTTAETAAALAITEAAVKVRLHRARLMLREKLADYFEEYVRS